MIIGIYYHGIEGQSLKLTISVSHNSLMCRLKFNTFSGHMHFLASKAGACIEAMLLPMMSFRALMIHDFTPNAPPSRYSLAPKP
jgi:hypothetical protein